METRCSFDSFGAPLIVLSDDILTNDKGEWQFGIHYEVVLYEQGINVWEINYHPDVMEGHHVLVRAEKLPKEFHVGITMCEGINRFYEISIE